MCPLVVLLLVLAGTFTVVCPVAERAHQQIPAGIQGGVAEGAMCRRYFWWDDLHTSSVASCGEGLRAYQEQGEENLFHVVLKRGGGERPSVGPPDDYLDRSRW